MKREDGWDSGFDWRIYFHRKVEVYKMVISNTADIQGVIALEDADDHVFVHAVESAPRNRKNKVFYPVGAVLFAFACRISLLKGYDGYVALQAKTQLIPYYTKLLGARRIGTSTKMYIPEVAARQLVEVYLQ